MKLSDNAFVVGGQALNLWAERYSHAPELTAYGPYTSKDIDYFGHRKAAQKLADALDGKLEIPDPDDQTPQTAIVRAEVEGNTIEIDFLWHVKGVEEASLKKQAVQLRLNVKVDGEQAELLIPIMHPFHCMQSRLANVVELKRDTDLALNQLEASPIVLREFLFEQLESGNGKHVTTVLQALYQYLKSDIVGRTAHKHMSNDPAGLFAAFQDDERLDERWREKSLLPMRTSLAKKRSSWLERATRLTKAIISNSQGEKNSNLR